MSKPELDLSDPSVAFGQDQGLFAYKMADSMTGETGRSVIERAGDAARTAVRQFNRKDIDIELATVGLMAIIEKGSASDETINKKD